MKKSIVILGIVTILLAASFATAMTTISNEKLQSIKKNRVAPTWIPPEERDDGWSTDRKDENGPDDGDGLDDLVDWMFYEQIYLYATLTRLVAILCPLALPVQAFQNHMFMYLCWCEAFDKCDIDGDSDTEPFFYVDYYPDTKEYMQDFLENVTNEYHAEFMDFLDTDFGYRDWVEDGNLAAVIREIIQSFLDLLGGD